MNELMKIKNVTNYDETDDDLRFIIMKIYDKKLILAIVLTSCQTKILSTVIDNNDWESESDFSTFKSKL